MASSIFIADQTFPYQSYGIFDKLPTSLPCNADWVEPNSLALNQLQDPLGLPVFLKNPVTICVTIT